MSIFAARRASSDLVTSATLLGTSASLLVTGASLVVTMFAIRNNKLVAYF